MEPDYVNRPNLRSTNDAQRDSRIRLDVDVSFMVFLNSIRNAPHFFSIMWMVVQEMWP